MRKTIHDPDYAKLVDTLRRRRLELGLRQDELGMKLGVSRNWVSKYELRETRLDIMQLMKVCRALTLDGCKVLRRLRYE